MQNHTRLLQVVLFIFPCIPTSTSSSSCCSCTPEPPPERSHHAHKDSHLHDKSRLHLSLISCLLSLVSCLLLSLVSEWSIYLMPQIQTNLLISTSYLRASCTQNLTAAWKGAQIDELVGCSLWRSFDHRLPLHALFLHHSLHPMNIRFGEFPRSHCSIGIVVVRCQIIMKRPTSTSKLRQCGSHTGGMTIELGTCTW